MALRKTSTHDAKTATRDGPVVPATMKAAVIDRFGPPEVFTIQTKPVPEVGAHEVLIALHASGVGFWDAKIRDGTWASGRERFPLVLGTNGARIVVAKGERIRRFDIGDRVWAYAYENPKGGFYAEYVAVDAEQAGRAPESLDLLHAGAAAVTGLTALQGIDDHLHVHSGETVLIFGASGAVGTLAVQFAKLRKARVLATASGHDAATLVRKLGADEVFDARKEDAVEQLRGLAPEGIHAVLALAGGDALERCLELVRAGGSIAYPNGVEPEPRHRGKVKVVPYDAEADPRQFERLERAVEEAHLEVPIAAVFPLEQAAKAHQRIEQGHVPGRIVLRIREDKEGT
jgi:NADPH:quinone reductase